MERVISVISILVSFIFFLILKLDFKYLILYFILFSLTILSMFIFEKNKKILQENHSKLVLGGSLIVGFITIIVSFYIGKKLIMLIPIFVEIGVVIYLKDFNVTESKAIVKIDSKSSIENYNMYIKKIDRRIDKCNDMILQIYQLNGADDELAQAFLSEIRLKLKDLEDEKEYLSSEIMKVSQSNLDEEKVISRLQNFYIDIEDIRISLGKLYAKLKGEVLNIQVSNEGYVDIVGSLERKIDSVLEEVKNNGSVNKKFFEHIQSELSVIDNRIIGLTDKFNKDMERIILNLNGTSKSINEALVDFDKNIIKNFEKLYQNIEMNGKKSRLEKNIKQEELFNFLSEKSKEQREVIEQEKEKFIEKLLEKINGQTYEINEEIFKYKNNFSEEGFNQLNNAEKLFNIAINNKCNIDDYSAIYINYTKFLEYEISAKMNLIGKDTSIGRLLKKMPEIFGWSSFLRIFEEKEFKKKRNLAAHGGGRVSLSDVKTLREFIYSEVSIKALKK